jgi:solute carrier family 25 (mitochondrial adenine nucleotide translocator), member 4/5/6/31
MGYYKQITTYYTNQYMHNTTTTNDDRTKKFISSVISGGLTGATATTILYPLEFARTRLAVDTYYYNNNNESNNRIKTTTGRTRNILLSIYQQDGIRGLYQGYGIAVAGGIFYRILHLGGYDIMKNEILHYKTIKKQVSNDDTIIIKVTWIERLCIAQFISIVAGTLSYPLDSIRRRLMMQAGRSIDQRQYTSAYNCIITIYQQEGIRGFYLGIGPNLLRSIGGALLLFGYDTVRSWL